MTNAKKCSYNPKFLPWVTLKWTQGQEGIAEVKEKFGEDFDIETIVASATTNDSDEGTFSIISNNEDGQNQIIADIILTEKDRLESILKKELIECSICKLTDEGLEFYSDKSPAEITSRVNALKLKYLAQISQVLDSDQQGYEYKGEYISFSQAVGRLNKGMTAEEWDILTSAAETAYKTFGDKFTSATQEEKLKMSDAYQAYFVLSNFDSYALGFGDIIKPINTEINTLLSQKYKYDGPVSKTIGGYNREDSPVSEILGELQKAVLDYLPQVGEDGQPIIGSSVGWQSFLANGLLLRRWAIENDIEGVFDSEGKINYKAIYQAYMSQLDSSTRGEYIMPELTSLRSLNKYIFDRDMTSLMDEDLYHSFVNALSKYVRTDYLEYIDEDDRLSIKPLTERFITVQKTLLKGRLEAATYLIRQVLSEQSSNSNSILAQQRIPGNFISSDDNNVLFTGLIKDDSASQVNLVNLTAATLAKIDIQEFMKVFNQIMGVNWNFDELHAIHTQISTSGEYGTLNLLAGFLTPVFTGKSPSDQVLTTLSRIYALFSGMQSKSVVKNAEGNNLPTYQLGSYAYEAPRRINQVKNLALYQHNFIVRNKSAMRAPFLRNTVTRNGVSTSVSNMKAGEVMFLAITKDFAEMLVKENSLASGQSGQQGTILIQPTTFADKNTHYLLPINLQKLTLGDSKGTSWYKAIMQLCQGKGSEYEKYIIDTLQESFHNYYQQIVDQVINDYKSIDPNLDSKEAIAEYLRTHKINDIRHKFAANGLDFIEQVHHSGGKINEELWSMAISTSKENFDNFIKEEFRAFVDSMGDALKNQIKRGIKEVHPNFKPDSTLWAYFLIDNLISHDYNALMVGSPTAHKGKDLSSRWVAATKRMVIYGATVHKLAQGLKNGVPEKIKAAVIDDINSYTSLITGTFVKGDANDGSGLTHPLYSRLANNSYLDGKGGANKKTIFGDMYDKHGAAKLLKWAEYEITNEMRRQSAMSTCSAESLLKKMSSTSLDWINSENVNLSYAPENLYYSKLVYENGIPTTKYYQILNVSIVGATINVETIEALANGQPKNNDKSTVSLPINSYYDLDQALGGCWCYEAVRGKLIPSEKNQDLICEIAIDLDELGTNIKQTIISYAINSSAIKVGAANVNSSNTWRTDSFDELMTITLDTRYGGMQLNSEHAIEDSDVTEVSQMISALEQLGYTHNKASQVYKDIAKAVEYSLKDLPNILGIEISDITPEIKRKYTEIFTDAFIESFRKNKRDTMGLAQAFIAKAESLLEEYNIPFSAGTINGIFGSIVTSTYVKRAIRRHYSGIGAVLVPAHNSRMLFNINGKYYTYPELRGNIHNLLENKVALQELYALGFTEDNLFTLSTTLTNGQVIVPNPVVRKLDPSETLTNINLGDTIIVIVNGREQAIVIDDAIKLHIYRNAPAEWEIYQHRLAPRNLSGPELVWYENGKQQSIYDFSAQVENIDGNLIDINIPLTLAYLSDSKVQKLDDAAAKTFFNDKIKDTTLTYREGRLPEIIRNTVDYISKGQKLEKGQIISLLQKALQSKLTEVASLDTSLRSFKPAQIMLGRLFAKQFGIKKGMSLTQCTEEFFVKQVKSQMLKDFDNISKVISINSCPIRHLIYGPDNKPIYIVVNTLGSTINQQKTPASYKKDGNKLIKDNIEVAAPEVNDVYSVSINGEKITVLEVTSDQQALGLVNSLVSSKAFTRNVAFPKGVLSKEIKPDLVNVANAFGIIKYQSFLKSLQMIGARIPCQNMTSFMAMEVAGFSDSDTNEVYLPSIVNILQGSDFDIDKQYILGYTVLPDGRILEGEMTDDQELPTYIADAITKNNVISGALDIVTDPRNQINLAMPVEMDEVAHLASKADVGRLVAMNPYSKYVLQEQNMVGKQVIGIMATGIKSFFALNSVYNERMEQFVSYLEELDPLNVDNINMLNNMINTFAKFTADVKGAYKVEAMLANINIDHLEQVYNNLLAIFDSDTMKTNIVLHKVKAIIDYQKSLPDVSQSLGQLLNAATDNAKHLYLKRINCDSDWAGVYAYALMIGMPLNQIGKLMTSPTFNKFLSAANQALFASKESGSVKTQLKNLVEHPTDDFTSQEIQELSTIYNLLSGAEELKNLGKALKINQGLKTRDEESYRMLHAIEHGLDINLEKFLSDPEYQTTTVQKHNNTPLNVWAVLAESPHFNAMLKALIYDRKTKALLSNKTALLQYLEKHHYGLDYESNPHNGLTSKGYRDLREDIGNFFIENWLFNIKQPILTFQKGFVYNSFGKTIKTQPGDKLIISDSHNQKVLLKWIEHHFIPSLKNTFSDNTFINDLFFDCVNGQYFYNLPIDMTKSTSIESVRSKFLEYQSGFNAIKDRMIVGEEGLEIDGKKLSVGDTLMLYNLLVHRDHINGHSLVTLFQDSVVQSSREGHDNLITEYTESMDKMHINDVITQFENWKNNNFKGNHFYEATPKSTSVLTLGSKETGWTDKFNVENWTLYGHPFTDYLLSDLSAEQVVELYAQWIDENPELMTKFIEYTKDKSIHALASDGNAININAFCGALAKGRLAISNIVEQLFITGHAHKLNKPFVDSVSGRSFVLKDLQIPINGKLETRKCLFSGDSNNIAVKYYTPLDEEFSQIMARHLFNAGLVAQALIDNKACWVVLDSSASKVPFAYSMLTGNELDVSVPASLVTLLEDTLHLANKAVSIIDINNLAESLGDKVQLIDDTSALVSGEDAVANNSALAFVHRGTIYINKSVLNKNNYKDQTIRRKTNEAILHEVAHIILGASIYTQSNTDPNFSSKYADFRGRIMETSIAKYLQKQPLYAGVNKFDMAEEVMAHLLGEWFGKGVSYKTFTPKDLELINEIFELFPNIMNDVAAMIERKNQEQQILADVLSNTYAEHQQTIAMRNALWDEHIKEECK